MVTAIWVLTFKSWKDGAFVPRGIIVEGVATIVILLVRIHAGVVTGKFFPGEVEVGLKNVSCYWSSG